MRRRRPSALDRCRQLAACHGAIRARQALSREQMQALLRQLDACANLSHCPHGRPTWLQVRDGGIERSFRTHGIGRRVTTGGRCFGIQVFGVSCLMLGTGRGRFGVQGSAATAPCITVSARKLLLWERLSSRDRRGWKAAPIGGQIPTGPEGSCRGSWGPGGSRIIKISLTSKDPRTKILPNLAAAGFSGLLGFLRNRRASRRVRESRADRQEIIRLG